jgi:hypothetical protein
METFKIRPFCATVARPDPSKEGHWLLMNRPDGGYAEAGRGPYPTLEAITENYDVHIGDLGADRHGAFVRMELGPAPVASPPVEVQACPPPASAPKPPPEVAAFMPNGAGARRRAFKAGPFRVYVEPHEDDAAQAAFTEALAKAAAELA